MRAFCSRGILSFIFLLTLGASAAEPKVENLVPKELNPIRESLSKHWGFLYERAEPNFADATKKAPTIKRIEFQNQATQKALELLRAKGHRKGTGKVLVMGGAYEVDLKDLFEEFSEVHVVDLAEDPLLLAARVYNENPKLRLLLADLSGIPVPFQSEQLNVLMADVDKTYNDKKVPLSYFEAFPKKLKQIPFKTSEYELVISPVLVESLPHGPLVAPFEKYREKTRGERKDMSGILGEAFFYQTPVMESFRQVFLHHSKELHRILAPNGVATFSVWRRDDNLKTDLAPQIEEELFRIGDDRMTWNNYSAFFKPWKKKRYLGGKQIYGVERPPTMHMYILEK